MALGRRRRASSRSFRPAVAYATAAASAADVARGIDPFRGKPALNPAIVSLLLEAWRKPVATPVAATRRAGWLSGSDPRGWLAAKALWEAKTVGTMTPELLRIDLNSDVI